MEYFYLHPTCTIPTHVRYVKVNGDHVLGHLCVVPYCCGVELVMEGRMDLCWVIADGFSTMRVSGPHLMYMLLVKTRCSYERTVLSIILHLLCLCLVLPHHESNPTRGVFMRCVLVYHILVSPLLLSECLTPNVYMV